MCDKLLPGIYWQLVLNVEASKPEGEGDGHAHWLFWVGAGLQSALVHANQKLDPQAAAYKVFSQTPFTERMGDPAFSQLPVH